MKLLKSKRLLLALAAIATIYLVRATGLDQGLIDEVFQAAVEAVTEEEELMDPSWILCLPRGVGHTTAAATGQGATRVLVCSTMRQAEMVKRQHGINATSLKSGETYCLGRKVPVVFDLEAVQTIINSYEDKLDKLRQQLGSPVQRRY